MTMKDLELPLTESACFWKIVLVEKNISGCIGIAAIYNNKKANHDSFF